jgi:hypothetical protein
MTVNERSTSPNELERWLAKAPARFVEFWTSARSALLRSLARKNDSEIQTAPISSAPSSTDRCLTRGCDIVANLIICEVPPNLEATLQTSRKNSGKPLIFCYLKHLLVPSEDVATAGKLSQKRIRRSLMLYFALRRSGHRRHSRPPAATIPRAR